MIDFSESTDIKPPIKRCRIPVFQPTKTVGCPEGLPMGDSFLRGVAGDIFSIRHITHVGSFNLEFPDSQCNPKVWFWKPCGGEVALRPVDYQDFESEVFPPPLVNMVCRGCCTCLQLTVPELVLQSAFLNLAIKQVHTDWKAGNFIHTAWSPFFQAIKHLGTIAVAGNEFLYGTVHDGVRGPQPFAFTFYPRFDAAEHKIQQEWSSILFECLRHQGKVLSRIVQQIAMGPKPISS